MSVYHFLILFLIIKSIKAGHNECTNKTRRPDPHCGRYQECRGGQWVVKICYPGYGYHRIKRTCVLGGCNQNMSSQSPNHNNIQNRNNGYKIDNHVSNISHSKMNEQSNSNGTQIVRPRRQEPIKDYKYETKRRGADIRTTLWYYNSAGLSYKFTIFGEQPAPSEEMVKWIENNSYKYRLTKVPFKGDAIVGSNTFTLPPPKNKHFIPVPAIHDPTPDMINLIPKNKTNSVKPSHLNPKTWKDILPSNCGKSVASSQKLIYNKIAGGDAAVIQENPWQVALVDSKSGALACGGSIISLRLVLSAAHCFVKDQTVKGPDGQSETVTKMVLNTAYFIYIGSTNLNEVTFVHSIVRYYVHDKYKSSHKRNDIALILIQGLFHWTSKIWPICIPTKDVYYAPGHKCRISGWGKKTSGSYSTQETLHDAEVDLVGTEDCKRENDKHLKISSGMFCAGDYEKGTVDTCQGDSGGPLTCYDEGAGTLFGITSWGIGCGKVHFPGVYTKVSLYRDWILEYLEVAMDLRSLDSVTHDEDIGAEESWDKGIDNEDPNEDILW